MLVTFQAFIPPFTHFTKCSQFFPFMFSTSISLRSINFAMYASYTPYNHLKQGMPLSLLHSTSHSYMVSQPLHPHTLLMSTPYEYILILSNTHLLPHTHSTPHHFISRPAYSRHTWLVYFISITKSLCWCFFLIPLVSVPYNVWISVE